MRTLVCTSDFSDAYISAKNEDNAMKLSGYDPLRFEKDYLAKGPSDGPEDHKHSPLQELE